jgi:hypothetical protein
MNVPYRLLNSLVVAGSLYITNPSTLTSACYHCDFGGGGWICATTFQQGVGAINCHADANSCTLSGQACIC